MVVIMNIGIFYQSCSYQKRACDYALSQLRKFYAECPVHLVEDGEKGLKEIADKYCCSYVPMSPIGLKTSLGGQQIHNHVGASEFLRRIYVACLTTLNNNDWVMLYEDDVLCLGRNKTIPKLDLGGVHGGYAWSPQLMTYFFERGLTEGYETYHAVGGCVFNREQYINCYESTLNLIDWHLIGFLDRRLTTRCNAAINFMFQYAGIPTGGWDDLQHGGEEIHDNISFFHGFKQYYA